MKKLLPLFLLVAFSVTAQAQAVFSLVTPPCNNNGILTVVFTGPVTPPLRVQWLTEGTTGGTIVHSVTGLTDALTAYSGGPLMVIATDTFGVIDTGSYAGAPPFTICPLTVLGGMCPALDTMIVSICSGGTAPFTFSWYNTTTSGIAGTNDTLIAAPDNFYGVTVTDAAGCKYGSMVENNQVYAYEIPSFSVTAMSTDANCTNGSAWVTTPPGGFAPFTYLWSTGATTPSIGSLVTGPYQVTVTDALGCKATSSTFVNQTVVMTIPVVPSPATCTASDGAVIAFGSGGTPPYSYLWSNGATTQSQTGLSGAFYSVNVTDANGCIGSGGAFVGVSTPIAVTQSATPSLCTIPTGTATLYPTGGTGGYTYTWYTTPAQTAVTATSLTSGTYSFQVTDAIGCTQEGAVFIPPVSVVSLSYISTPATCTLSNGSMTVYPTGGVTPYTYSWATGGTTATITSKPSGLYPITVTDNLGCKITRTAYLPYNSTLGVGIVTTPASCLYANDGIDSAAAWGGTPPYAYGWSTGGTTRTISALPTGPYWVRVTDASGCTTQSSYSYVPYDTMNTSCYCTIEGTVYYDVNANCSQESGEPGIPNMQIRITGGTLGNVFTYTNASGYYSYRVPSGTYTVSEKVLPFYPLSVCQFNNVIVPVTAGTGCISTVNFSNDMDTVHDMHISTWSYTPGKPVVGNAYTQITVISNDGSVTEDSVIAGYKPDGQIFSPSFVHTGYFSGTPYWYHTDSFPSLAPGTAQRFFMKYTVPTNIPFNTNLVFKDTVSFMNQISNWLTDHTPWNNVCNYTNNTVASYDPNFKEVYPKGTGPIGIISYTDTVLEYMVHFQNTGTWMAENIVVIDTLDDNLDWTSLRPVYATAPCKVTMKQSGTRKVVTYTFNNINLTPAATDELLSHGMFTYTIHTKPALPTGTQFRNRASIYFDYNEPIMTNTTLNTLGAAPPGVGVNNIISTDNSFAIFPNPANLAFNAVIESLTASSADMKVSDITGKLMITKTIALQKGTQTIATDVSQLAPGVYFVSLIQDGKTQTQKLVIMK